jgi:hypothetical protein
LDEILFAGRQASTTPTPGKPVSNQKTAGRIRPGEFGISPEFQV